MAERKFKFVSPGVFVQEIDNSFIPALPGDVGPVIVGRTDRGPGMRPVKVNSFSEFIEYFGNPVPPGGLGENADVFRYNTFSAPTYAAYAAQAYLRNGSTATIVRVLGEHHADKTGASTATAGWRVETLGQTGEEAQQVGGAFGLFLIDSGSFNSTTTTPMTGGLAAIWYSDSAQVALTGTTRDARTIIGTNTMFQSLGGSNEFKAVIMSGSKGAIEEIGFNFDPDSDKFIRKVFNTNPALTNTAITDSESQKKYWLGESYEQFIDHQIVSGSTAGAVYGTIFRLEDAANGINGGGFKISKKNARSGWIFSQDMGTNPANFNPAVGATTQKLFQFHSREGGTWANGNIKISVQEIKDSTNDSNPYGTFTVVVRRGQDTDNAVQVLEKYPNCNLNPNSENYIARKIGDKYVLWDDTQRRNREYGSYDNNSKYIRVEMNTDVDAGFTDPDHVPFGFYGPPRFRGFQAMSGSTGSFIADSTTDAGFSSHTFAGMATTASLTASSGHGPVRAFLDTGLGTYGAGSDWNFTGTFHFPKLALRKNAFDGNLSDPTEAYWGITTDRKDSTRFDPSVLDLCKPLPEDQSNASLGTTKEYSFVFTLDDLKLTGSQGLNAHYVSGSRASNSSLTAQSGTYQTVLDKGYDRFTLPMFGGFDGFDIKEADPIRNSLLSDVSERTSYSFNSVKRAIDAAADPEVVEMNLMALPGITNTTLSEHMLHICEDRADALAVIDLPSVYTPKYEGTSYNSFASRLGDVDSVVTALKNRGLNSSYGCTYYPWVQIRDTINGSIVWVPPSVAALGTFASSEKKSELWFAPAGFNRGGLTVGSAGVPVTNVTEKLRQKDRDKLYAANINPIASFPAEGIVIFGQKTLQVTPSALDRINVRRLLIYLKREISRMANQVLFEQNVQVTWNSFLSMVNPFLKSVKARLGLTDFKVVLDETTTTPDLVDRNILYAKIFLKPARSIEFIALDFVITRTGAAFED